MQFKDWLAQQIAERDWGVAEAAGHIGVSHSMVSRYLNGKARPERKTLRALAATFGIPRDELEAMVDAPKPPPVRWDNVEPIDLTAMTQSQAVEFVRMLMGVLRVVEGKARGEAHEDG